jgi:glutaredoxin
MGVATAGLCEKHELPLDAHGECELCRLNAIPSKAPPSRATSWIVVGLAAFLLGGGVLAFLAAPKFEPEPPPRGARNAARQAERAPAPSRAAPPARPRVPDRPSSVPLPPTPTKSNDRVNTAPIPVPPAAPREQRTFTEEDARAALAEVQIEMYATSWCPSCRRAREYLDDNQISYTEYDIDEDAAAKRRLAEINQRTSIPTFQIDDIVQVGFSPENFQRQLNRAVRRRLK